MSPSRVPTVLTLAPVSLDTEAVKPWSKPTSEKMLARPAYYPFVCEWEGVDELLDVKQINDNTMISRIAALERVAAADFHSEVHLTRLQSLSRLSGFRQFLGVCLERSRELEADGVTPLVLLLRVCSWLRLGGGENRVWYLSYTRRLALALEEALTRHGGRLRPAETLATLESWARWDGLGAAFRRGRPSFALSVQAALSRAAFTAREAVRALAALAGVRRSLTGYSPPAGLVEGLTAAVADGLGALADAELTAAAAATRELNWPYHRCCVPLLESLHTEALDRACRAQEAEAKLSASVAAMAVAVAGGGSPASPASARFDWVSSSARRAAATASAAKASACAAAEAVRCSAAAFHKPTALGLKAVAKARGFGVDAAREEKAAVVDGTCLTASWSRVATPVSAQDARRAAVQALAEAPGALAGPELEDLVSSMGSSLDEADWAHRHAHHT